MQQSVIFGILLTILNHRKVKREYLAEKFEVSTRTVQRYIDVLGEAGVPIISTRGKNGGFSVTDDFKLDSSFFTEAEVARIISCLNAMRPNYPDSICRDVTDKLLNASRNKQEEKYLVRSDSLVIDVGSWNNPLQYRGKMQVINKAIETNTSVILQYVDAKEYKSQRKFDPYSLVLKEGVWYVYGFCYLRNDFRLFRLARIKSLTLTEEAFEKRPSDVYEKLKGNFDDNPPIDVEFEFYNTVLAEVEEWLGTEAVSERGTQYVAKATLYDEKIVLSKLLSFGSSIKVISPKYMKDAIKKECQLVLKNW
ncbi:MAG: YafY family transcriptional regulator [Clostridia bacterium]|nr:YafY family transcriptional regulator [Clostridia bacterium]